MTITRYKLFWAWQFEKEENWLNKMSQAGFQLISVSLFTYKFKENKKVIYNYKLELLEKFPNDPISKKYIEFLEETNVEYVDSLARWAYFRKNAKDGEFDIYSDLDSKIAHYKRILFLFLCLIPLVIFNMSNAIGRFHTMDEYSIPMIIINVICVAMAVLLLFGIISILKPLNKLKKEKEIRE